MVYFHLKVSLCSAEICKLACFASSSVFLFTETDSLTRKVTWLFLEVTLE
jgi:hypothetical protein